MDAPPLLVAFGCFYTASLIDRAGSMIQCMAERGFGPGGAQGQRQRGAAVGAAVRALRGAVRDLARRAADSVVFGKEWTGLTR